MATTSDKSGKAEPPEKPGRIQDFFLDPLPVLEARESNGDTVWGMWEESLEAMSAEAEAEVQPGFEKTEVSPLYEAPDSVKPGKSR